MKFRDVYLRKEIDLSAKMIMDVRVEAERDSDEKLYYKTVVGGYGDKVTIYMGEHADKAFRIREVAEKEIKEEKKDGEENVLL